MRSSSSAIVVPVIAGSLGLKTWVISNWSCDKHVF
jgi:hypothetical protein